MLDRFTTECNQSLEEPYKGPERVEELVDPRGCMAVTECKTCGAQIRAEGLARSYGGHTIYCVTCGAQFHAE
jgi:hypothetical protein